MTIPEEYDLPDQDWRLLELWYQGGPLKGEYLSEFNQHQFFILARHIPSLYQREIRCKPLRDIVLAILYQIRAGTVSSAKELELRTNAINALCRNLRRKPVGQLEGGDMLAIALLAFSTDPSSRNEWENHAYGFHRLIRDVSAAQTSETVPHLWPFARDFVIGFQRWNIQDAQFFNIFHECSEFMKQNLYWRRRQLSFDRYQGLIWDLDLHIELLARAIRFKVCHGHGGGLFEKVEKSVSRAKWDVGSIPESGNYGAQDVAQAIRISICQLLLRMFESYDLHKGFERGSADREIENLTQYVCKIPDSESPNVPIRAAIGLLQLAFASLDHANFQGNGMAFNELLMI